MSGERVQPQEGGNSSDEYGGGSFLAWAWLAPECVQSCALIEPNAAKPIAQNVLVQLRNVMYFSTLKAL